MEGSQNYINLAYLKNFSNGNEQFIKDIISISIVQTEQDLNSLKEALDQEEHEKIRPICHKLRSSFGFMGVNPGVIEKLKETERLTKEETELLKKHTQEIIKTCLQINRELKEVLTTGDAGQA